MRDGGDINEGVEDRESTGGDTERAVDRECIGGEMERAERAEAGDLGGRPRRDGEGTYRGSRGRREELVLVSEDLRTGVRLLPLCSMFVRMAESCYLCVCSCM